MSENKFISGKWRRTRHSTPQPKKPSGVRRLLQRWWRLLLSNPAITVPLPVFGFAVAAVSLLSAVETVIGGTPWRSAPIVKPPDGMDVAPLWNSFIIANPSGLFPVIVIAYVCEIDDVEGFADNQPQYFGQLGLLPTITEHTIAAGGTVPARCVMPFPVKGTLYVSLHIAVCYKHSEHSEPHVTRSDVMVWEYGEWTLGQPLRAPALPFPRPVLQGVSPAEQASPKEIEKLDHNWCLLPLTPEGPHIPPQVLPWTNGPSAKAMNP